MSASDTVRLLRAAMRSLTATVGALASSRSGGKQPHSISHGIRGDNWNFPISAVEATKVIDDVKKRQLARFADNPPSPSCALAIRELVAAAGGAARQLHNNQMELADDLVSLDRLRVRLLQLECLLSPTFNDTVRTGCVLGQI